MNTISESERDRTATCVIILINDLKLQLSKPQFYINNLFYDHSALLSLALIKKRFGALIWTRTDWKPVGSRSRCRQFLLLNCAANVQRRNLIKTEECDGFWKLVVGIHHCILAVPTSAETSLTDEQGCYQPIRLSRLTSCQTSPSPSLSLPLCLGVSLSSGRLPVRLWIWRLQLHSFFHMILLHSVWAASRCYWCWK